MNTKEYNVFLNQKVKSLQTLLDECRIAALNREIKTEKCFETKRDLIAEIRELKAQAKNI